MTTHATAVIPARDESVTVGSVVDAAATAGLIDEVVVVDNASEDGTAEVAASHGARVVREPQAGKGEALAAGVRATDAEVLVFLDADLLGLRPEHVDKLVSAVVVGGADVALGHFDRGSLQNTVTINLLPRLTGQRCLRRELFESLHRRDIEGYRVEAALNNRARELGLDVRSFILEGVWHRTKEEKHDTRLGGWLTKIAMLGTATGAYVAWWTIRRRRHPRL